jgi:hypothetical protein
MVGYGNSTYNKINYTQTQVLETLERRPFGSEPRRSVQVRCMSSLSKSEFGVNNYVAHRNL